MHTQMRMAIKKTMARPTPPAMMPMRTGVLRPPAAGGVVGVGEGDTSVGRWHHDGNDMSV